jgi:hypothetical protein
VFPSLIEKLNHIDHEDTDIFHTKQLPHYFLLQDISLEANSVSAAQKIPRRYNWYS